MIKRLFKFALYLGLAIAAVTLGSAAGFIFKIYTQLPELDSVDLAASTLIYDSEGVLLDEVHGEEHRKIVELENVDLDIINAIIAIEDKNFYSHNGVDKVAVIRAIKQNIEAEGTASGASTLTMQLIKNLYLTKEVSWNRKITEAFLAIELEKKLTKEEILELYVNTIYWGNNTYGIETATETYFGKSAKDVEIHEAAMLAALIQNPSRYNPYEGDAAYALLKSRQKEVLLSMADTETECDSLAFTDESREHRKKDIALCKNNWVDQQHSEPLLLTGPLTWKKSLSPFVTEAAIKELEGQLNLSREDLEVGGYKIVTTVNKKDQDKAIKAVANNSAWKGTAQMALVSIDVDTNKIVATVGSKDFDVSPLNRSLDSYRQPGSAVKPFVYYTAFDYGIDSQTNIIDEPYCINNAWESYCPKNYGGSFAGVDTIENHLIKSRNIPAVKVGQMVGIKNVIANMRDLGFTTKFENVPSFPLGSNDVRPVEMANAYAAFSNGGYIAPPTIIETVTNISNEIVINNSNGSRKKVLDSSAVADLDKVLKGVVSRGTGTKAAVGGLEQGGKTGTTNGESDVWFVGYTNDISTAVWIGNDDYKKKLGGGATGGGWAAPVYRDFVYYYYN